MSEDKCTCLKITKPGQYKKLDAPCPIHSKQSQECICDSGFGMNLSCPVHSRQDCKWHGDEQSQEWTWETIAILQAKGGVDAIAAAHNAALAEAEKHGYQRGVRDCK
jgi:hypothetical protein